IRQPPTHRLLPYTTLFRSAVHAGERLTQHDAAARIDPRIQHHLAVEIDEIGADDITERLVVGRGEAQLHALVLLVALLVLGAIPDRKSTRLNSSHVNISYA